MSTEQEAREAASRVECVELVDMTEDVRCIVMWATCEFTRRDAELPEREKPITAEWWLANGATLDGTAGACQFIAHGIEVEWDARNGVTVRDGERMSDWTFVSSITTRGQLLDLLKALRGGT